MANPTIVNIAKKLEKLGWKKYGFQDYYNWADTNSNRHVQIDLPYIDFFIYQNEEKYKGYLTVAELHLFYRLVKEIKKHENEI